MKLVIGVAGFAGSGKDTFGDYLVEHYGFQKASFATPLKEACRAIYAFTDEQLYGEHKEIPDKRYRFSEKCVICGLGLVEDRARYDIKRYCVPCDWGFDHDYITPRLAMQTLGTEWGRRLCDSTWTEALFNVIGKSDHNRWVICDVRFRNEMHAIQDRGGYVVRLMRGSAQHSHQSEMELTGIKLSEYEEVIDNAGSLPDFYREIDTLMPRFPEVMGSSAY